MASINILGQMVITDTNGGQRTINLNLPQSYSYDSEQTFSCPASTTVVIYNSTDLAAISPAWTAMFLFPSVNLDLSMGIDAGQSDAVWNTIPLTASQPFALFRNSFYANYVNASGTNIFAGTSGKTCLKMSVNNPSSTTAGTIQVFICQ